MTNSMRQDLIGYLLDLLEPEDRQRIEEELGRDPALLEELAVLRSGMDVLDDGPRHCEPPEGLAGRTCKFVARHAQELSPLTSRPSANAPAPEVVPADRARRRRSATREPMVLAGQGWRFADIAMATAISVAAAALIFPLINVSRANARVAECANKLRQVGSGLTQYSEQHNGYFPRVEETGNLAVGGIYAPTLLSEGYVTDPRSFVCPSSDLADDSLFHVPSLEELHAATGETLAKYRLSMGGSFGYVLGYREKGAYRPTRNLYRDTFALAADVPAKDGSVSLNHGWMGHNVLLEDGHIVYLRACRLDGSLDNIFVNDEGRVAAGCHVNDAVVVRSEVTP